MSSATNTTSDLLDAIIGAASRFVEYQKDLGADPENGSFIDNRSDEAGVDDLVFWAQKSSDGSWRAAFSICEGGINMTRISTGSEAFEHLRDPETAECVVDGCWDEDWND